MALTKVTKSGITDNAIDADKIEDGTVVAADIAPGTITDAKLASTLDLSAKTVTLPNCGVSNAQLAGSIANAKLANSSITINGSSVSLGGSVSAGQVSWQSVKTADFTAVAGEGYFVDTNSVGAVTATLPGSPSAGDTIAFKDYAANFGTNALTIARNGNNIQGVANNSSISTNRASIVLVYIDATKGWLYTNESNISIIPPTFITATGGTVTTSGDFKIHTFTGDGCFVVSSLGGGIPCAQASTVDYLVVAGGGGAGSKDGAAGGSPGGVGGGGAGGFRESKDSTLSSPHTASPLAATTGITVSATTYPITVGGGGSGGSYPSTGSNGSNSVFSTITSAGGGGGSESPAPTGGNPGGSGGGGNGGNSTPGGSGNTPPVAPSQGNPGGTAGNGGGGGGGATAVGVDVPGTNLGGDGGAGATTSITGSPTSYAGGGGGGGYVGASAGTGGAGGGGNGNTGPGAGVATSGSCNTGGGAGGTGGPSTPGVNLTGASGGKGIVIIRYKFQ